MPEFPHRAGLSVRRGSVGDGSGVYSFTTRTLILTVPGLALRHGLFLLVLCALLTAAVPGWAAEPLPARLCRLDIVSGDQYTRLRFKLDKNSSYTVDTVPGNRLRIRLDHASSPHFKKLHSFTNRQVQGVIVRNLMGAVVADIGLREQSSGFRVFPLAEAGILVVDVGQSLARRESQQVLADRQQILLGAGKLVKEYDPPLTADFPFIPTDPKTLAQLIPASDLRQFASGEAFLYQGQAAEAETVFAAFVKREHPIGTIAAYRLGEARYALHKYKPALDAFRQGEANLPSYLQERPITAFSFADTLVRAGGSPTRKTFSHLIAAFSDKPYASLMVARLADVLARQGNDAEALLIYRTVIKLFPGSRGAYHAAMQLADRQFFSQNQETYPGLLRTYREIADASGDFSLKDEASFKEALLESLYGPPILAMAKIGDYEKRFPSGIFVATAKSVRELLLPKVYWELFAARDYHGLLQLVQDNRSCLAGCLADPRFLPSIMEAFAATGQIKAEIGLLAYLMRYDLGKGQSPEMILRILADADRLADNKLAEEAAIMFLERFPKRPEAGSIRERLAALRFQEGRMESVITELTHLLKPKVRAEMPESYYYLGKALVAKGKPQVADRALSAFIAARKGSLQADYRADAYYTLALTRQASGNRRGAIDACKGGLAVATDGEHDQFLYKLGELLVQERRIPEARAQWEKLAREGRDEQWRKLAGQAMASLDLQQELSDVKSLVSK